jgi:tetratricopeptide (TPR) repeat protein
MSFAKKLKIIADQMDRVASLHKMLESTPDDLFLHYALAMEYLSASEHALAMEKLEWIKTSQPGYLAVYYQLAKLYEQLEEAEKAIDIYEQGIEVAREQGETKTMNELRSALDELIF